MISSGRANSTAHQENYYPIASTTMDFNSATAQMAFGLYLALFIVFVLQKSVSGADGVPMWVLVLHYVTGFLAVFGLMALVTIDLTLKGFAGATLWAVSALITLVYFFSMLRNTILQRRATLNSNRSANLPLPANGSANAAMTALVASSDGAAIAAASAVASAAALAAARTAAAIGVVAATAAAASASSEPTITH